VEREESARIQKIPMAALKRFFLCLYFLLVFVIGSACSLADEPESVRFTVVTYNVENLFDADGVAMFEDYKPRGYTRAKFYTKLKNTTRVLRTINQGAGPEIILFQELEADVTPDSTVEDYAAFLDRHKGTTVEAMLGAEWSDEYAGYPASAWLLKTLSDFGLKDYEVATVPSRGLDSGIAHTNAVYSRFPIRSVSIHPLVEARDILEAELDVAGHPLHVYVNHWKSGASNPQREPIRVENARVLRALLDARLAEDPNADILVAGDLNAHYNQSMLFPDIETGINDILGSAGAEDFSESDLYNLWFELPPEERYSEVWRGRRGSLMHQLITQGLYDDSGISYVDGSFDKLVIKGLNADAIGRPIDWNPWGDVGSGFSDHFPLVARFQLGPFEAKGALSKGSDMPSIEMPLRYAEFASELTLEDGGFLSELEDAELPQHMGQIFSISGKISPRRPTSLLVNGKEWPVYLPDPALRKFFFRLATGSRVEVVATLGTYRGKAQLVIEAMN